MNKTPVPFMHIPDEDRAITHVSNRRQRRRLFASTRRSSDITLPARETSFSESAVRRSDMKASATMRKFGLLLLVMAVTLPLAVRADDDRNGQNNQGNDQGCRDEGDNDHNARTPLKLIGVIPVPGNPIISADIAWVDPGTEAYYLADRSNAGVDIIDVETNFFAGRVKGLVGVVGPQDGTVNNNGSGPNGVVVSPQKRVWIGDGNDTLKVADVDPESPGFQNVLGKIDLAVHDPTSPSFCDNGMATGHWCGRADEIGFDPRHRVVLIATPTPFSPTHID